MSFKICSASAFTYILLKKPWGRKYEVILSGPQHRRHKVFWVGSSKAFCIFPYGTWERANSLYLGVTFLTHSSGMGPLQQEDELISPPVWDSPANWKFQVKHVVWQVLGSMTVATSWGAQELQVLWGFTFLTSIPRGLRSQAYPCALPRSATCFVEERTYLRGLKWTN